MLLLFIDAAYGVSSSLGRREGVDNMVRLGITWMGKGGKSDLPP